VTPDDALTRYVTRLGDNALVLGQRMIELVAASPELEEELASANFSLDYIGQARMFYTCAGEREGVGRDEDDFAFLRPEHEYRNLLLVEQPNGHFGDSTVRAVLFESFYVLLLDALTHCSEGGVAEIAVRAIKEVRYHLKHSSQWLVRLGDGTEESHDRAQQSLDSLWRYTGEMFVADEVDAIVRDSFAGPDLEAIAGQWRHAVTAIVNAATLDMPDDGWMATGGKEGRHTEHFGYLLADLQIMQRTYPGQAW